MFIIILAFKKIFIYLIFWTVLGLCRYAGFLQMRCADFSL